MAPGFRASEFGLGFLGFGVSGLMTGIFGASPGVHRNPRIQFATLELEP